MAMIETISQRWQLTYPVGSFANGTSFTQPIPTITAPTGNGVVVMNRDNGEYVQNGLVLMCVAGPSSVVGDTIGMKVFAWTALHGPEIAGGYTLWIPFLLFQVTWTISTSIVGVANAVLPATYLFCDQVTLVTGNSGTSVELLSPGSGDLAHVVGDLKGCRRFSTAFSVTSGDSASALWRFV